MCEYIRLIIRAFMSYRVNSTRAPHVRCLYVGTPAVVRSDYNSCADTILYMMRMAH